jgi:hypothetical protein
MGQLCILQTMYQTFVWHYMIMIGFYHHLGSYVKTIENKYPMSWPWCISQGLKMVRVCISWFFLSFFSQIGCIVVFFFLLIVRWGSLFAFYCDVYCILCCVGIYVTFYMIKSLKTRENKDLVFYKKEYQENNS